MHWATNDEILNLNDHLQPKEALPTTLCKRPIRRQSQIVSTIRL